jgi:hypothetical protein
MEMMGASVPIESKTIICAEIAPDGRWFKSHTSVGGLEFGHFCMR